MGSIRNNTTSPHAVRVKDRMGGVHLQIVHPKTEATGITLHDPENPVYAVWHDDGLLEFDDGMLTPPTPPVILTLPEKPARGAKG